MTDRTQTRVEKEPGNGPAARSATKERLIVLRRILALFCLIAAAWTVLVARTGGFRVYLGAIRVSSRDVWNPLAFAALSGAAVWALSAWLGSRGSLHEEWAWWKRLGSAAFALSATGFAGPAIARAREPARSY